jgi:hypothetical protein
MDIAEELLKGMDANLISEEVKAKVMEMVNKLVADKTATLNEEIATLKNDIVEKEAFLKEAAQDFGKRLQEEYAQKEAILMETLKEYQDATASVLAETAAEYRDAIEKESLETANEYKTYLEQTIMESAAAFKKMHEEKSTGELSKFKQDLLEKADKYIEAQLTQTIPQQIRESAAKAAALEPLVENMVHVIEKYGISVDKTGFETLKAAKEENAKLNESVNTKAQENVKLGARVKALEKQVKLTQLTEGMTQAQKTKAVKLLESCSVETLDAKFKDIKDIIIAESAKPKQVSLVQAKTEQSSQHVQKQVTRIVESIKPQKATTEIDSYADTLDRMRRH